MSRIVCQKFKSVVWQNDAQLIPQHLLRVTCTVESHNSGQVGRPEIVPYCGIFPYFASSLFTNGHFGHSGFVPYFASFPYFAVPYCEHLLYVLTVFPIVQFPSAQTSKRLSVKRFVYKLDATNELKYQNNFG